MSVLSINSRLGNNLQELLMAEDILPGDAPSYQTCKTIYAYHPLGAKMAESPIRMAQSQQRTITVQKGPEERVREQFLQQWSDDSCDKHIFNTMRLARIYGISSVAVMSQATPPTRPIDFKALAKAKISFNVFDPLNTAGSLVLNQDPNAMDFQKTKSIAVNGVAYHPSRCVIMLNEDPLYIQYTTSAFGYVGRSVYQRVLFPLKSFVQSMLTDDLVTIKAGVIVAKQKMPGSIINNAMKTLMGVKRAFVQEARVGNILSISTDEEIESLNLQNIDMAHKTARRNIIENIATGADMPAKLLLQESFAEGFGEGTEDAKYVAGYIDGVRVQMNPLYDFFDEINMYRAWNPEFYETIQNEFPEYEKVPYVKAFYDWKNSFTAAWPSLLTEPDSEKIKVDDVKLKAVIALLEVLLPMLDPANKVLLIQWAADNFNELKLLFGSPLDLNMQDLIEYQPSEEEEAEEKEELPNPPKPMRADSQPRKSMVNYTDAVTALTHLDRSMKAVPPRRGQSLDSYLRQNGIRR